MTSTDGTTTSAYGYDTAGRMVSRPDPSGVGTQSLSWDVLSNLTGAGGETYLYDGSGQRVARITGGAATVWVGSDELTDPDTDPASTGDVTGSRYYTLGSSTVAVRHGDAAGTVPVVLQLVLGDVQGSAQVTVDATLSSGAVVAATGATSWSSSAYGPYGTTRDSDNLTIARGWLGQVEDTTTPGGGTGTGLTYLNARYYDPVIGRFLSPDPLMDPGDPRTLDPYRYADNNPMVFMDPAGLSPSCGTYPTFAGAGSSNLQTFMRAAAYAQSVNAHVGCAGNYGANPGHEVMAERMPDILDCQVGSSHSCTRVARAAFNGSDGGALDTLGYYTLAGFAGIANSMFNVPGCVGGDSGRCRDLAVDGMFAIAGGLAGLTAANIGRATYYAWRAERGIEDAGQITTLYRAIEASELGDLVETGTLNAVQTGTSTAGKYFWTTREGALAFGNSAVFRGDFVAIEVRVSAKAANDSTASWHNLDGFGQARYYEGNQWENLRASIHSVRFAG